MHDLVDTLIEDDRWEDAGLDTLAKEAATAALLRLSLDPEMFEISLLGCDDARIADLNAQFREKPTPTNVLSWPAGDLAAQVEGAPPATPTADPTGMPTELGDIAISFDTCTREAEAAGKPFSAHVKHLLVHGVLHLLGYDHISEQDASLMEGLEIEILATMGLSDPYGE